MEYTDDFSTQDPGWVTWNDGFDPWDWDGVNERLTCQVSAGSGFSQFYRLGTFDAGLAISAAVTTAVNWNGTPNAFCGLQLASVYFYPRPSLNDYAYRFGANTVAVAVVPSSGDGIEIKMYNADNDLQVADFDFLINGNVEATVNSSIATGTLCSLRHGYVTTLYSGGGSPTGDYFFDSYAFQYDQRLDCVPPVPVEP